MGSSYSKLKESDGDTLRIVLLGKTGSGKSSLGNIIFGSKKFKVNNSPNSGTNTCESKVDKVHGRTVQLIDTPGFFDTDPRSTDLSPAILKCVTECAPGPHAFLLVLKLEKFTKQEQAVVDLMQEYFSEEVLRYTTVVFTRGDDLPEGMKIEKWVNQSKALKDLVQKCGGRCHVVDNKLWNNNQDPYRNNQVQFQKLLETIDQTLRNNGGECYTNELLKPVSLIIKQEAKCIKESSPNISDEESHEKAKESVFKKLLKGVGCVMVGVLWGAIFGIGVFSGAVMLGVAAPCLVNFAAGAVGGAGVGAMLEGLKKAFQEVEIHYKNDKFEILLKTSKEPQALQTVPSKSEKTKFE